MNVLNGMTKTMRVVRRAIQLEIQKEQQDHDFVTPKEDAYRYLLDFVLSELPIWTGPGYRGEYTCPCGVGHGNHVHGCCGRGCCQRDDFPLKKKIKVPLDTPQNTEGFPEEKNRISRKESDGRKR